MRGEKPHQGCNCIGEVCAVNISTELPYIAQLLYKKCIYFGFRLVGNGTKEKDVGVCIKLVSGLWIEMQDKSHILSDLLGGKAVYSFLFQLQVKGRTESFSAGDLGEKGSTWREKDWSCIVSSLL